MYISDDVILHGWGQACPGIPKEAIKSFNISKTKREAEADFVHAASYLLKF